MAIEIERKFLVLNNEWKQGQGTYFSQGYLNREQDRTIRVRIAGDHAYLTIKSAISSVSRKEFEYEIPVVDGKQLLALCEQPIIEKIRYLVEHESFTWEIDEFLGQNEGLVVAEIELKSEHQTFNKPAWLGQEVTEDARYYNSNLTTYPFQLWDKNSNS